MNGYQLYMRLNRLMIDHKNTEVFVKLPTGELVGLYQPFRSTVDTDLSDQRDPFLALRITDSDGEQNTVESLFESLRDIKRFENTDLFNEMEVSVLKAEDPFEQPNEYPITAIVPAFSTVARNNKDAVLCY